MDLGGTPGLDLRKCVGQCKKVHKTNEPNDCPKDWKIISPQNKDDLGGVDQVKVYHVFLCGCRFFKGKIYDQAAFGWHLACRFPGDQLVKDQLRLK